MNRANHPKSRATLADRFALWFSKGTRVDGLWIGGFFVDKSSPAFSRVEEALHLIKTYDKICYSHLIRDLDRIWVMLLPSSRGSYIHALRACKLDERFLTSDKTRPDIVASVIVHEATHARLLACGIGYGEDIRARVERVCIARQLAFAAKLPNGQEVRTEADRKSTRLNSSHSIASRMPSSA